VERFICIHGHFYQPPRENPWLEAVEVEDTAHPYHDWNERVTAECYAPNGASRILDNEGKILEIVGNYAGMSFNFGPTLLSWMETASPGTYQAILEADRQSAERHSGHGGAIAQAYNHIIMPLANRRDKWTQVRWGIRDFEYRFGRPPEGMWLPETAVDSETLDILAEHGIRFTILAPHQASEITPLDAGIWEDAGGGRIDPTRPYLCKLASGRSITLFFYDGPISKAVAFEGLLNRGEDFIARLAAGFSAQRGWPQILHIATDGETYGHHHKFADMALAFALRHIEKEGIAKLSNYGEYLEKHPPEYEVRIKENTSWSCAHGIERWRRDCGCNSGGHQGWSQAWRTPLREAFDRLRDRLSGLFEEKSGQYLKDPWEARDAYIEVILNRSEERVDAFLKGHALKELEGTETSTILKLMEMERHLMLMYTSCGWFFDEISGIETVQVMRYAGRAIQLANELFGVEMEDDFKAELAAAKSNLGEAKDGAHIYEGYVKPAMVGLDKVAAHYAMTSLLEDYDDPAQIYCYSVKKEDYQRMQAGETRLAVGRIRVTSAITLDTEIVGFSALHLGGHVFDCGVDLSSDDGTYQAMKQEMKAAFERGDFADTVRLMDRRAAMRQYSLLQLFRDGQRKILSRVIEEALEAFEHAYRPVYENSRVLMLFVQRASMPVPKAFLAAAEFVLNVEMRRLLETDEIDPERVRSVIDEVAGWGLAPDRVDPEFAMRRRLERMMEAVHGNPWDLSLLSKVERLVGLTPSLPMAVNLWHAQNIYFEMARSVWREIRSKAKTGDEGAVDRMEGFTRIGQALSFNVAALLGEGQEEYGQ
jgi:alpha-amylase/alpha-mannosidase (GH57 family)